MFGRGLSIPSRITTSESDDMRHREGLADDPKGIAREVRPRARRLGSEWEEVNNPDLKGRGLSVNSRSNCEVQ